MKDLSRRAKVLLVGSVVGVLGSGLAGALVIPASAHPASARASSALAAPSSKPPLVSVCITVIPLHIPRTCVAI